ncbi:Metallo-dependent hydrolase [Thelephora ganbajun]|uniref:Metallo-dependent hydrolase n=1 Tax=Thelephora ganbajun TaxID=370292 RepID=A0ACB6ZM97_THEGA|nr:Metallo-dependent hydrolase [Thelephora ganbajun]
MELPPPSVLAHVVDVHCHPTDTDIPDGFPDDLHITICAMSARTRDQPLVRELATRCPDKVIPAFGYHPWWAHQIALTKPESKRKHYESLLLSSSPSEEDLAAFEKVLENQPEPRLFDDILLEVRKNLSDFPSALVGEIGLDRPVRIPYDYDATPRVLSQFTIPFEHQLKIFEAQLELAVELKRNVSMHSVRAHDATMQVFERIAEKFGDKFWDVSVDLHSCGASAQMWKEFERKFCNVFISPSTIHNTRSENYKKLVETVSPKRLLIESDYYTISDLTSQTIKMLNTVSEIKGWPIEQEWIDEEDTDGVNTRPKIPEEEWGAVRRLESNWKAFLRGGHRPEQKILSKFKRFHNDWVSDEADEA